MGRKELVQEGGKQGREDMYQEEITFSPASFLLTFPLLLPFSSHLPSSPLPLVLSTSSHLLSLFLLTFILNFPGSVRGRHQNPASETVEQILTQILRSEGRDKKKEEIQRQVYD